MATIDNFDEEWSAGTGALQATDKIPIHEASSSLKKYLTGAAIVGAPGRVVTTTATALSLTQTQHSGKVVVCNTNSTVANTFTLPAATGTGAKYEIVNGLAQTQGSIAIKTAGSDVMKGRAVSYDSTAVATHANFFVTATATQCAWNRTTTGGIGEDRFVAYDESAALWRVFVENNCSGSNATPFT